jgi:multiple sugar transport system permease protein
MYAVLTPPSLVILYPLAFMVLATFTTPEQYLRTSFLPIPNIADFRNYEPIVSDCTQACIYRSGLLTLLRVSWYIGWGLLVSVLGGYVFGRLVFPLKTALFVFFLSGLMVPPLLTTLPLYVMLARFPLAGENDIFGQGGHGFINQWPALGMLGLVNVLGLFLVKQNYEMFPRDYEEAGVVDGANTLQIIFQVYVPMLRPALTAVAILESVAVWNDYFGPLIYVGGNRELTPIALAIQRLIYSFTQRTGGESAVEFPLIFAAATLMSVPTIVAYLALQRYFVQGLIGVGIKG